MITFKCKMCGGDLHPEENASICECEYCGSVQTVPSVDVDKKAALFNRANRLRMNAEFDKAAAVYQSIVTDFPEEAEAYWGLCLCDYGIEYVDDPQSGEKKPTCHRTLPTSIMDDSNFEQACDCADTVARRVFCEQAKDIDRIQKDILTIAASEAPYDVFICYKETDDNGERTEDSVLAQDIYDALSGKGLKVFFARISLEDKLGRQYEPYIYAALSSAKVMVAVGTRFEYYDAVWVKNEWMRFLHMMTKDKAKSLIPCFKDLDAYDMPKEFKNLQAQDMAKLGWLQDLTRGVMKLCGKDKAPVQPVPAPEPAYRVSSPTVQSLLDRAFIFLEDGQWDSAAEYADKVLDMDVKNGKAYLVKLQSKLKAHKTDELKTLDKPFDTDDDYAKILRFGDDELKETVKGYIAAINEREETKKAEIPVLLREYERLNGEIEKAQAEYEKAEKELNEKYKQKQELKNRINTYPQLIAEQHGLFAAKKKIALEEQRDKDVQRLKALQEALEPYEKKASQAKQEIYNLDSSRRELTEIQYKLAKSYYAIGSYNESCGWFLKIRGYKDVDSLLKNNDNLCEATLKPYKTAGSFVTYGSYPQTSGGADKTAIEWIVLEVQGDKALLISRYGLDALPYNKSIAPVTWETCTLRSFLNKVFLNTAFTVTEQKAILTTRIDNSMRQCYSGYRADGGNDTEDKIFLLSYDEANRYFGVTNSTGNNTKSRIAPTGYAIKQGAATSSNPTAEGTAAGWWWLRSPGDRQGYAAFVSRDGSLFSYRVDTTTVTVRPAFWIDLNAMFVD